MLRKKNDFFAQSRFGGIIGMQKRRDVVCQSETKTDIEQTEKKKYPQGMPTSKMPCGALPKGFSMTQQHTISLIVPRKVFSVFTLLSLHPLKTFYADFLF